MRDQQDIASDINPQELEMLHSLLSRFLSEQCGGSCLDNDEEVEDVSGRLAHFLLTPGKEMEMNVAQILPKAKYKMAIRIVDEPKGKFVCELNLPRTPDMSDGDFLQLQNFMWVTLGTAIVGNRQLRKTLEMAGIEVIDSDSGDQGNPQEAA